MSTFDSFACRMKCRTQRTMAKAGWQGHQLAAMSSSTFKAISTGKKNTPQRTTRARPLSVSLSKLRLSIASLTKILWHKNFKVVQVRRTKEMRQLFSLSLVLSWWSKRLQWRRSRQPNRRWSIKLSTTWQRQSNLSSVESTPNTWTAFASVSSRSGASLSNLRHKSQMKRVKVDALLHRWMRQIRSTTSSWSTFSTSLRNQTPSASSVSFKMWTKIWF